MGHNHDHGHSHCHDEHDHDDHQHPDDGEQKLLYSKIDLDNVEILNGDDDSEPKKVIKPWHLRNDDQYIESDADEQLIVRIPFTGSVKLRSIIIRGTFSSSCPQKVKLHVNENPDFEEASTKASAQDIDVVQNKEAVEYPLRPAKFPNVRSISVFVSSNFGDDISRLHFIGFKGDFTELKGGPVNVVYEAQANPADHKKIPGLDGASASMGQ